MLADDVCWWYLLVMLADDACWWWHFMKTSFLHIFRWNMITSIFEYSSIQNFGYSAIFHLVTSNLRKMNKKYVFVILLSFFCCEKCILHAFHWNVITSNFESPGNRNFGYSAFFQLFTSSFLQINKKIRILAYYYIFCENFIFLTYFI